MARLTAAQRRKLPKSDFAVPSKAPGPGSFPMPDKAHEIAAKRLVGRDPSAKGAVAKKAKQKFGDSDGDEGQVGPLPNMSSMNTKPKMTTKKKPAFIA